MFVGKISMNNLKLICLSSSSTSSSPFLQKWNRCVIRQLQNCTETGNLYGKLRVQWILHKPPPNLAIPRTVRSHQIVESVVTETKKISWRLIHFSEQGNSKVIKKTNKIIATIPFLLKTGKTMPLRKIKFVGASFSRWRDATTSRRRSVSLKCWISGTVPDIQNPIYHISLKKKADSRAVLSTERAEERFHLWKGVLLTGSSFLLLQRGQYFRLMYENHMKAFSFFLKSLGQLFPLTSFRKLSVEWSSWTA
jgi:hypothetical protein